DNLVDLLSRDPAFRAPDASTSPDAELATVEAQIRGDSRDEAAVQAIERLRAEVVPRARAGSAASVYVTGETAEIVDYREMLDRWLPIVFLYVLGFSFV